MAKKENRLIQCDEISKWFCSFGVPFPYENEGELMIPSFVCHADLTRLNLIFSGESFFYIDFESFGRFLFFYGPFRFLWSDWYYFQSTKLFIEYLNGAWDDAFTELFEANGLKFLPERRLFYFGLFLYDFCAYYHISLPKDVSEKLISLSQL